MSVSRAAGCVSWDKILYHVMRSNFRGVLKLGLLPFWQQFCPCALVAMWHVTAGLETYWCLSVMRSNFWGVKAGPAFSQLSHLMEVLNITPRFSEPQLSHQNCCQNGSNRSFHTPPQKSESQLSNPTARLTSSNATCHKFLTASEVYECFRQDRLTSGGGGDAMEGVLKFLYANRNTVHGRSLKRRFFCGLLSLL
jgi:hypothetical protein